MSLLLCAVVLFTPYIVLNILAERRLIAVSDLSVIKIGTSIWNLLYIWIIAPKVDKKIDKIFEKNINTLKSIAEELCSTEGVPITFCNTYETSGESKDSKDWYNTIHFYRIKMYSTVTKNENMYTMDVRYGIEDYYDWELGLKGYEDNLDQFINYDKQLFINYFNIMNRAGMARNYTNFGEINTTVTWSKN